MPLRHDPLPKNAAQLTRIILSLNEANADLKARVDFLERQLFGTKSKKLTTIDATQAVLDLGDLSDIPVAANDDVAPVGDDKTQVRRSPARNIGHLPKTFRVMTSSSSRRARFALAAPSSFIASELISARRSTLCPPLSG